MGLATRARAGDGRDLILESRLLIERIEDFALRRAAWGLVSLAVSVGWPDPLPLHAGVAALAAACWFARDLAGAARLHRQARQALAFLVARDREQRTQAARVFLAGQGALA